MPASPVQSSSLVVGGYPSASTSFSSTPTVGGTVLVTGTYSPSFGTPPTGVSITDNQGNTYSVLRSVSSIGDSGAFIGYAAIGTASGTFTVTATVTGGSADAGVMVSAQEWSGLDNTGLLDQQGAATLAFGTGTDQTVTASGVNAAADRVVIGVLASRNSASISSVQNSPPITGYTNIYARLTVSFGEPGGLAAYKIVSATETSSVNWGEVTDGGFISALQIATFAVAAGGGTSHAATGVLTGQGSSVAGTAARTRAHPSSGALTGPGSSIVGSAQHNVPHASSGSLTGPGSSVVGSAARTRAHPSSGALTGPGSTVAGTAARTRQHAATGVLTGPGSEVAGTAARTRQHAGSGDLVGPGSAIVGSADHQAAAGVHEASGALVGQGSSVAGTAARFRAFAASGALTGQGSAIAGTAARVAGPVSHAASGVLVGPGALVVGSAARANPAVSHDATGDLVGPGSIITGQDTSPDVIELLGGGPGGPKKKKKRVVRTELDKDSYLYRLLSPEVRDKLEPEAAEVIEAKAVEVVEQKSKPSPKAVRAAIEDEGLAYRQAYKEIYLELIGEIRKAQADEEEEEEAIAMALLL